MRWHGWWDIVDGRYGWWDMVDCRYGWETDILMTYDMVEWEIDNWWMKWHGKSWSIISVSQSTISRSIICLTIYHLISHL